MVKKKKKKKTFHSWLKIIETYAWILEQYPGITVNFYFQWDIENYFID